MSSKAIAAIRIALVSRTFYYVPFWAAMKNGYFRDEGLDVEAEILDSTGKVNSGLIQGKFEIGIGTPEGVIADHEKGENRLVIVAGNAQKMTHFLIAQPSIRSFADLHGASIGVASTNEGTAFVIKRILSTEGLAESDYSLVDAGGVPSRWIALQEKRIDAGLQSIPINYAAEDAGYTILCDSNDYVPDYQFVTVNVTREWVKEHGPNTTRFLRALGRGTAWMFDEPESVIRLIIDELGVSGEHASRGWEYYTSGNVIPRDQRVSKPGMNTVFSLMEAAGAIEQREGRSLDEFVDSSYLDAI